MPLIVSQGSGATVATESISGQHYGYNKITDASLGGSATVGMIVDSSANASGAAHVFLRGNITINPVDPKTFIGLVTVGNVIQSLATMTGLPPFNSSPTIQPFVQFFSAPQSIASGGFGPLLGDQFGRVQVVPVGNVTLSDPKGYIGLVTVGGGTAWTDPKAFIGLVTIGGIGTVTLSDPKGYIGLVTIGGIGTVTLADPKGFIGLVTTVPTFLSGYTSLATIISAVGVATIVIPPSGQKIFVKTIHVGALGYGVIGLFRANIATATAAVIPYTSLSTTGGYIEFFGESGSQWGLADDGLTAEIKGSAATIALAINCRFA